LSGFFNVGAVGLKVVRLFDVGAIVVGTTVDEVSDPGRETGDKEIVGNKEGAFEAESVGGTELVG